MSAVYSATNMGLDGIVVRAEAVVYRSLPQIQVVGLPGDVVKEGRERVRGCLSHLGFKIPSAKIVVHLSPATLKKQGSQLDVSLALCLLGAEGYIEKSKTRRTAALGELSLDGQIHRVVGAVGLIEALEKSDQIDQIIVPTGNSWEAKLLRSKKAFCANNLAEVIGFFRGDGLLKKVEALGDSIVNSPVSTSIGTMLDQIIGQPLAKRALQVALSGRHHLLMMGPPGVGKSLTASCAPGLMPHLEREELVSVAKNFSHQFVGERVIKRPFRSPHHSISAAALLGGGSGKVTPGEVTLAHTGVLFLDELPEFRRDAIEGLREPLQNGVIHLHRTGHSISLPARFVLIAAMNPCPCGHFMSAKGRCRCEMDKIRAYRKRLSGPILDRMDLFVTMSGNINEQRKDDFTHAVVKQSIARCLAKQKQRFRKLGQGVCNGDIEVPNAELGFELDKKDSQWLRRKGIEENLSHRSLQKILKLARTIADLDEKSEIRREHLQEAWGFKCPNTTLEYF